MLRAIITRKIIFNGKVLNLAEEVLFDCLEIEAILERNESATDHSTVTRVEIANED